tara:strand:- start:449 stop:751 length:303 start_codon:yes stop_codon:yes gene_type:complete
MAEPGDEYKDIVKRRVYQERSVKPKYVSPRTHTVDWDKVEDIEDIKKILIEITDGDFYINPSLTKIDARLLKKADVPQEDKYPMKIHPLGPDDKSKDVHE